MNTPYREFVADIGRHLPPHEGPSLVEDVIHYLEGPATGLEGPQWALVVEVIATEARDPCRDDEARRALFEHANRSNLSCARRARAASLRSQSGAGLP